VSEAPKNRRRAPSANGIVDAPADPVGTTDESPVPPLAASKSVRPPPPPGPKKSRFKPLSPRLDRLASFAKMVFGAAVVLAASVAVAWGARRYILTSPRFAVRTVLVEGNGRRSAEQLATAGGVAVGKNIFALDLAQAAASIMTDPWIENAKVTRKLPATIHIAVAEREARAVVTIGGELYLVTREGDLFKRLSGEDPSDLPVITGIDPEAVARDRAGVVLTLKRVLDVADDLERSPVAKRYPIEEINVEKDGALVVTIGREAIALHLGQPPYRGKIEQAARVLGEVSRRKANASVLFLDNVAHPERVVVRMR
jgi:cell division protein FtsQ